MLWEAERRDEAVVTPSVGSSYWNPEKPLKSQRPVERHSPGRIICRRSSSHICKEVGLTPQTLRAPVRNAGLDP